MKLETLTPEQEKKMTEVKQYWLDYIFSCKNSVNRDEAKISIEWLYKFSKLGKPVIIYVDSPMSCQIAVLYLKEFLKVLKQKPLANVWENVEENVEANVWENVWENVEANVGENVRANVGENYESFSSYGNVGDYGWVSFYDFFTQIGVLDNKDFNQFKGILTSGIYDMIQLNGFCIVSDMPSEIKRNNDRLHSVDGPAISFKDGYSQYYINGRALPEKYFKALSDKTFTVEDFAKEQNEEYKSTCIAFMQEKYGEEYLVNFFREHLKEIDSYVDKKEDKYLEGTTGGMNVGVYTLFKGTINNEPIAYVRCYCPSSDRMFFLGVDSSHKTAKDAIGSLYRIPTKLKPHIKSISRQGERFSTILTEDGQKILKGLSESEIANVSGLSGDKYFELMKYEF